MILEYVGPGKGPDAYQLWACRGESKGCSKKRKKQKHCAECVACHDMRETLEELLQRMERGDA